MKKIDDYLVKVLTGLLLLFLISCKNKENTQDVGSQVQTRDNPARIEFVETEHDFGKVLEGEKVGWYFKYRNTGGQDLIIQNATSTCGCTVPDFSRKPLPPGEEATLKVIYDSSGRKGRDTKIVRIISNAETQITSIKLNVEVIEKSNI